MIGRSITRPLSTYDRTKTTQTISGHTSLPWAAFEPSGRDIQSRLLLNDTACVAGYSDCAETDIFFSHKSSLNLCNYIQPKRHM